MEGYVPKLKNTETSTFKKIFYKNDTFSEIKEKEKSLPKFAMKLIPKIEF